MKFKYITDIDNDRHLLNINQIAYISDSILNSTPSIFFVNMIDGKTFRINTKEYDNLVDFILK